MSAQVNSTQKFRFYDAYCNPGAASTEKEVSFPAEEKLWKCLNDPLISSDALRGYDAEKGITKIFVDAFQGKTLTQAGVGMNLRYVEYDIKKDPKNGWMADEQGFAMRAWAGAMQSCSSAAF